MLRELGRLERTAVLRREHGRARCLEPRATLRSASGSFALLRAPRLLRDGDQPVRSGGCSLTCERIGSVGRTPDSSDRLGTTPEVLAGTRPIELVGHGLMHGAIPAGNAEEGPRLASTVRADPINLAVDDEGSGRFRDYFE